MTGGYLQLKKSNNAEVNISAAAISKTSIAIFRLHKDEPKKKNEEISPQQE